jgi:hypothetical protein
MPTPRTRPAPRALALIALGSIVAPAGGCRGKVTAKIDGADLEQRLIKELADHDFPAAVACPRDREMKRGDVFTCKATGTDGTPLAITVTQEDGDGTVAFEMGATFIDSSKVIDNVKAQLGSADTYTCPKRWLLMRQKGEVATCAVHRGTSRGRLLITLQDVQAGNVTWEVKPD